MLLHLRRYLTPILMQNDAISWREKYNHPVGWDQHFSPLSLPEMFFQSADRDPDAVLLDFLGRRYSYAECREGVRRVAHGLQAMGIGKGDRVGLFLPNVPHYVAAYYGALAIGATVVNFSPLYTAAELEHQVEDSGAKILFTLSAKALLPTALEVLDNSSLERLVVGSVAGALPPAKSILFRLFRRSETVERPHDPRITAFSALIANDGSYVPAEIDAEKDVALLQYTGGTTGRPKGAKLTHQNLSANARQVNMLDPGNVVEDRMLGVLPFFHVFANTVVLNRTIFNGGEIFMLPIFDAVQTRAAVARTRHTALPGVPTISPSSLVMPRMGAEAFHHIRVCQSVAAEPDHIQCRVDNHAAALRCGADAGRCCPDTTYSPSRVTHHVSGIIGQSPIGRNGFFVHAHVHIRWCAAPRRGEAAVRESDRGRGCRRLWPY